MAGIGFELRKLYQKRTLASRVWGTFYATMTTIGPSMLFAVLILFLKSFMSRSDATELENRFFISSLSYIFMGSVLISALFSTVVSRYISDCIFSKREKEICASVFGVLTLSTVICGVYMLVLCVGMALKSGIGLPFLCIYYLLGILAANAYNLIIYVSALKEYKEVTLSYLAGLLLAIPTYLVCDNLLQMHTVVSVYLALLVGFFVINFLLITLCVRAFGWPNTSYFAFLQYFRSFPQLFCSGFFYMLGFYITTIIYWQFSDMRQIVSIFSTTPEYDMAMFLAIVVNMPALVIFVVKTETSFFEKYVRYLSALNKGSYALIEKERQNMCNIIRYQLFFVYEVQLIVTVLLIFLINILFPYLNIGSQLLNMFLLLGMGLYCVFCMYFTVIFLYYFEDHAGSCIGPCVFLGVTILTAIFAVIIGKPYYPLPLLVGGLAGWIAAFLRLRYRLNTLNAFLMCR